jgi:hypothetical protein
MTITINGLTDYLLVAVMPFLLVCAVYMLVGFFTGPKTGGFRLVLPWPWLWITLPMVAAGLWGIVRTLST